MLLWNQKLEKLTINGYKTGQRTGSPETFGAMYNPTTLSHKYKVNYDKKRAIGSSGSSANYIFHEPEELSLKLVLDGTGVDMSGRISSFWGSKTVSERIQAFKKAVYNMDGTTHELYYLTVSWGNEPSFNCRLSDRDGSPLRAELDITLIADNPVEKTIKIAGKSSPDLTHTRIVKSGDTLPQLTREIYGSPDYYLRVAQVNNLNDFRNLTPGQALVFPPLSSAQPEGSE